MWFMLMLLSCVSLPATANSRSCPERIDVTTPSLDGSAIIVVHKAKRSMGLYARNELVQIDGQPACWPVGLAAGAPQGTKTREGDLKTPEGWYRTSDKPWSSYAGAIAVHYPNIKDAEAARKEGRIDDATASSIRTAIRGDKKPPQNTPLGGEILLHGGGAWDWTLGCIALEDTDLDTLRAHLPADKKVDLLIRP